MMIAPLFLTLLVVLAIASHSEDFSTMNINTKSFDGIELGDPQAFRWKYKEGN